MTTANRQLTPMEQRYRDAKAQCPDCLLLFKMGDFYEAFDSDADTAAKVLELTLTKRGEIRMTGFPYHQLDGYLAKLVAAGHRTALVEQVS